MYEKITVQTIINAPMEKVWTALNEPEHITKWAFADPSWEAPRAENDLRVGGKFMTRMQAKDGSAGFDFGGVYTNVVPNKVIEYDMSIDAGEAGARHVKTELEEVEGGVKVTQTFDPENINSMEMQRVGWQAILNNFKNYAEGI